MGGPGTWERKFAYIILFSVKSCLRKYYLEIEGSQHLLYKFMKQNGGTGHLEGTWIPREEICLHFFLYHTKSSSKILPRNRMKLASIVQIYVVEWGGPGTQRAPGSPQRIFAYIFFFTVQSHLPFTSCQNPSHVDSSSTHVSHEHVLDAG